MAKKVFTDESLQTFVDEIKSYTDESVSTKANSSHTHSISNVTNLQSTLDAKQATITGAATTITGSNLTASRALVSNSSGKVAVSAVTSTELGYLDGVTSAIQTQLDGKAASSHNHSGYDITSGTVSSDRLPTVPVAKGGTGATTAAVALTNLGALPTSGGTMNGAITMAQGNLAKRNVETSGITIYGGTAFDNSASLGLYGKDQSNYPGYFRLTANNGTDAIALEGRPNGSLAWGGKEIFTVDDTIPISSGGTGATTAADARSSLGAAPVSHASSATTYGAGTSSNYGHVKLSDSTSSTSSTSGGIAATPKAVKTAYDLANTANTTATAASTTANTAVTTANAAMPKSGGTFTGNTVAIMTNREGGCIRNITVQNSKGTANVSTNYIIMRRK